MITFVLGFALAATLLPHDPVAKWEGDAAFAKKTRMHHRMGIMMTEHCTKRATHPELKQFCEQSLRDQQQDLEKLNALAPAKTDQTARADSDASSGSGTEARATDDKHRMQAQGQQMMALMEKSSGQEFERMFLIHNAKHHQQVIDMASGCEKSAEKDELKQFCSELKSKQSAEKQKLEAWQRQWYPNADKSEHPH